MSVAGYLSRNEGELKLKEGDVRTKWGQNEEGVLEGKVSVEVARMRASWKRYRPDRMYANVGQYDPVLRSHCRLDQEG